MCGIDKPRKETPSTFYVLAFCVHVIGFVVMAIGVFTPYWSTVVEFFTLATPLQSFDKGLIISCTPDLGQDRVCSANQASSSSDPFFAAYAIALITLVVGFFVLQVLTVGVLIRSCRQMNLGLPLAVTSMLEGFALTLVLVLFEHSLTLDLSPNAVLRESSFGLSRALVVGAVILYLLAGFLLIGEHFRRRQRPGSSPSATYREPTTKAGRSHPRQERRDHRSQPRHTKPSPAPKNKKALPPPPYEEF